MDNLTKQRHINCMFTKTGSEIWLFSTKKLIRKTNLNLNDFWNTFDGYVNLIYAEETKQKRCWNTLLYL